MAACQGFSNTGDVRVDSSDNDRLETYGNFDGKRMMVRRGCRVDKYVATYKFKWALTGKPGFLVRWLDRGNWLAVFIKSTDGKARLNQRKDDGNDTSLATSGTALSLTNGTWYTAKVLVDDDPNNASLQRFRFWVDTDGDSDFSDETTLLDTTAVDDDWSGGYVGLFTLDTSRLAERERWRSQRRATPEATSQGFRATGAPRSSSTTSRSGWTTTATATSPTRTTPCWSATTSTRTRSA